MQLLLTPYNLIKEAIKAVPAVKYALGIAGISTVIAIIAGFNIDKDIAIFGSIIIILLMMVLAVFAKFAGDPDYVNIKPQLIFFTWASLLLTVATATMLMTCYFFEWPKPLTELSDSNIKLRVESMLSNKRDGNYINAEMIANEILKKDQNNFYALNTKGAVNFYQGNFEQAANYFAQALKQQPKNFTLICNLADAYVELGTYTKAIETYETVELEEKNNEAWWYSFGRANLYAGKYSIALENLGRVPDSFNKGSARILEATALLIKTVDNSKLSNIGTQEEEITKKIKTALTIDREHWKRIFDQGGKDKNENHTLEVKTLKPFISKKRISL